MSAGRISSTRFFRNQSHTGRRKYNPVPHPIFKPNRTLREWNMSTQDIVLTLLPKISIHSPVPYYGSQFPVL